jgi:hypothetical protein
MKTSGIRHPGRSHIENAYLNSLISYAKKSLNLISGRWSRL